VFYVFVRFFFKYTGLKKPLRKLAINRYEPFTKEVLTQKDKFRAICPKPLLFNKLDFNFRQFDGSFRGFDGQFKQSDFSANRFDRSFKPFDSPFEHFDGSFKQFDFSFSRFDFSFRHFDANQNDSQ
jgi:hypothetical protein